MARRRFNGLTATLGVQLEAATYTIVFAAPLTCSSGPVPNIGPDDRLTLTLLDEAGEIAEIVDIYDYVEGQLTASCYRGMQNSTPGVDGIVHSAGTAITHAPTEEDFRLEFLGDVDQSAFPGANQVVYYDAPSSKFKFGSPTPQMRGVKARATSGQSLPSASYVNINFNDFPEYNPQQMFNLGSPDRVTIPAGLEGVWRVTAGVWFPGAGGPRRVVGLNVNGAWAGTIYASTSPPVGTANNHTENLTADLLLYPSDYVQLVAMQDSGSAQSLGGAYLAMHHLGRI